MHNQLATALSQVDVNESDIADPCMGQLSTKGSACVFACSSSLYTRKDKVGSMLLLEGERHS